MELGRDSDFESDLAPGDMLEATLRGRHRGEEDADKLVKRARGDRSALPYSLLL